MYNNVPAELTLIFYIYFNIIYIYMLKYVFKYIFFLNRHFKV